MIHEKKQMKLIHQENLQAIEAQNRILNDLKKTQIVGQQILLIANNGGGSTDRNLQAKLHTILQQKQLYQRGTWQILRRTGPTKRRNTSLKMWTYKTPSRSIEGKREGCEHPLQRFFKNENKFQKCTVYTSQNEQETGIYAWTHPHLSSRTARNPGWYWPTSTEIWRNTPGTKEESPRCPGTYAKNNGYNSWREVKTKWRPATMTCVPILGRP